MGEGEFVLRQPGKRIIKAGHRRGIGGNPAALGMPALMRA
jgi:hypothetical protein